MALEALTNVRNGCDKQLFVTLIKFTLVLKRKTLIDGSLAHVYIINVSVAVVIVIYDGKYIHIVDSIANNFALTYKVVEQ